MNGWKTVGYNAILVLTGFAGQAGIVLPENFADTVNGFILAGIGIGGIILRAVTTSKVGWKS